MSCHPLLRLRCAAAAALFLACIVTAPVAAQGIELNGRVVDTAGVAVPGLAVVFHRVDGSGGARIAESMTRDDGTFSLASPEAPVAGAVYFVAARIDGQLYIGPFLRAPFDDADAYTVVVGGEPVDLGSVAVPPSGTVQT
ncbi:MAG: hypothetical protein L0271_07625, partial [Gemmatimonadetes bacterium]|nr:hypothetical protein [Gemmatimonadota bacterium]